MGASVEYVGTPSFSWRDFKACIARWQDDPESQLFRSTHGDSWIKSVPSVRDAMIEHKLDILIWQQTGQGPEALPPLRNPFESTAPKPVKAQRSAAEIRASVAEAFG